MPRFTRARDLQKHLEDALSALQKETLVTAQKRLGSKGVSPYDTGRFRSSWFAAEGQASDAEAPVGTDAANENAQGLPVVWNKTYHLTNNLPYAPAIALGVNLPASWGGENRLRSKPATWFTSFRNQTIPEIQRKAARTVKQRFEL